MYKRVLIKLSGEALSGSKGFGINQEIVDGVIAQIKQVREMGIEVAIVIGGGNFWRGRSGGKMNRTTADHMGMLATVINSLAMQDALEQIGLPTRVQTALTINSVAEPFILRRAIRHLEKGRIVIFACGTGNPYFSTDSGAALRSAEINADALLLAKNIDGIYSADPKVDPKAIKYEHLTYMDFISKGLSAMDTTAVALCADNDIPIIAFGLSEENSIVRVASGEKIGTLISK